MADKRLVIGIGADTKELEDKAKKAGQTLLQFTDSSIMNIGEMRKELKTLGKMSLEGLSPDQIDNIRQRMAALTDEVGDAAATIKSMSGDPFQKVAEGIGSVTTMASGLSAAYGMLGGDQKEMEAMMQRTVAMMAIANSAQEASIFLNERAYGIFIKNKTKEIAAWITETITINSATASAGLFNKVIAQNPIVWLIAGVAALTAGVYLLVTSFDYAAINAAKLRTEISKMTSDIEDTKAWGDFANQLDEVFDVEGRSSHALKRLHEYKYSLEDLQNKLGQLKISGTATDEEKKRYNDLSKEIVTVGDQIILAKAKTAKQEIDNDREKHKQLEEEARKAAERRKAAQEKADAARLEAQLKAIQEEYDLEVEQYQNLEDIKKKRSDSAEEWIKFDSKSATDVLDQMAEEMDAAMPEAKPISLGVRFDISGAMAGVIEQISSALGEAVATGDWSNFGSAILNSIAGFMQQVGAMFIAFGVAQMAFQTGVAPPVLIAAGAAMVAIGAGIKAATSKSATKAAASGGGGVSGGGGASGGWDVSMGQASWGARGGDVRFVIEGSQLVGVLGNENNRKTTY